MKAEHFERQVQRLEQERDQWEKKYEVRKGLAPKFLHNAHVQVPQEAEAKFRESKKELDELIQQMDSL